MNSLRVKAIAYRHFAEMRHSPARNNDLVVWPIIDTLLFGSLGAFLAKQLGGGDLQLRYVLTGLLMYHVVYQSSVALSLGFMNETNARNIMNLVASPVTVPEYLAGLTLWGAVRMLCGVLMIAVFTALFFSFNVLSGGAGLLVVAVILASVGLALSFILIGLQVRLGHSAEQMTWVLAVLIPTISGAFYPVAALPAFLQPLARNLPTTHGFTAARTIVDGGPFPWHDLLLTAVGGLAFLAMGLAFLAVMLRRFQQLGMVTRYS